MRGRHARRRGSAATLAGLLAATAAHGDTGMPPPVSGFRQPRAPCRGAAKPRIVTQVGLIPGGPYRAGLHVVATTQPDADRFATVDAHITLFDTACRVVYNEAFPDSGEATFEVLHWPHGATLLHVVTVSAVSLPADDTLFTHYLLLLTGYGLLMPVQPGVLMSDRSWRVHIGRLDAAGDYGVVKINTPFAGVEPQHLGSSVLTWRWTSYKLLDGPDDLELAGPMVVKAPLDRSIDAWPDTSWEVGFPLWHYLFKDGL